jgi:hypothetical protein
MLTAPVNALASEAFEGCSLHSQVRNPLRSAWSRRLQHPWQTPRLALCSSASPCLWSSSSREDGLTAEGAPVCRLLPEMPPVVAGDVPPPPPMPCWGTGRAEGLPDGVAVPVEGADPPEEAPVPPPPEPPPPEDEPCAQAAPATRKPVIRTAGKVTRMGVLPTEGSRNSTRYGRRRFQISCAIRQD